MQRVPANRYISESSPVPRRGSMLVLSAFMMVIVMAVVAFAVDLSFISMTKSQLQNASDSAALATVAAIANTKLTGVAREAEARQWAIHYAERNQPNAGTLLADADITLGRWDRMTRTFIAVSPDVTPNAVEIVVRRTGAGGNEVPLFFGPVLGYSNADVTATTIATVGEDDLRDIMIVIDCSGSMKEAGRMTALKPAVLALIDELLTTDRLGLTVYSYMGSDKRETGIVETSLDLNHDPTVNRVPALQPAMYTAYTNIAGGIRVAVEEFITNPRSSTKSIDKIMVLMTDGHANRTEPPEKDPNQAIMYYAAAAAAENITIHSVSFGNDADTVHLRAAAELTGGTYHHVADGQHEELLEVFKKLGRGSGIARIVR